MQLLRKLSRNWQWVLINVLGLTLAYACITLVFSFTSKELSYDNFHSKSDRIYRATASTQGYSTMHPARVWGEWVPQLPNEYPAIENFVRMVPFKKGVVEIEEQRFYSNRLFKVDSSFFEIYDFELLSGNRKTVLHKPQEAVVAKSLALKYFGDLDVLGKQIKITHQQLDSAVAFTIVGVMDDIPTHSHFHAEVLTTIPNMEVNNSWGYTYYLMKQDTDVEGLRSTIQEKWDSDPEEGHIPRVLHFQKLTDIHLYSHKTREIEANGDIRSLILLLSGALIILFVALINFLNLSKVQFIAATKSIKIKMINGATKAIIGKELAIESLILSLSTLLLGLLVSYRLSSYLKVDIWASPLIIVFISLVFVIGIAALSVFPLFTSKIVSDTKVSRSKADLYTFPLVVQFALAVVAITGTIVLQRQMNFLNNQHPQAKSADIVVVEKNPWTVVQRYERFKNELLNDPSIVSMTGAMEEPGGDVLDNFRFEMEGFEPDDSRTMYVLTTDDNFLSAMNVEPLAGTIDLGYTADQQWEEDAMELSMMVQNETHDQVRANELFEKVSPYREKYVLNQSALKMLGIENPEEAIGRSFRLNFQFPFLFAEGEVVGVVPDLHYTNLHNEERPMVIVPRKMFNYNFLIRIDPKRREEALASINSTWAEINPEYPLAYNYINDSYERVYATEYAQSKVLSLFAVISVLLSALGIYAIAAFSMQRRVKEIGVRKVNGATVTEIMLMLNKKFIVWVAVAFVIAIPIAWYAMNRWLESFAYKTELSWWIFALAGLIAMAIALVTVSVQSYRAAIRNPIESLRYE